MIRFFARWRAKRRYIWKEKFEAGIADLQADLAADRAKEKLTLAAQLVNEAEAIEENIRAEEAKPEYQALQGNRHVYPRRRTPRTPQRNHHRRRKIRSRAEEKDAEKIAASKRQEAKQEEEAAQGSNNTAVIFRRQAAAGRETADRLRRI